VKKGILVIAACLLAASCAIENGDNPEPLPEATSPANCLKCVEVSFNQRNAALLDLALDKGFVFFFDPDDVGQHPPGGGYVIPESWSYAEFAGAASNMFSRAYSLSLVIPTGGVGTPGPNESPYKVENINIKLLVMIDELNGYIANEGYCNFEFERYDGKEGEKLWRLAKWWDNTAVPPTDTNPPVTPVSLGRVLALYR